MVPNLVLPSELKLPICIKTEPSLPTVVLPITVSSHPTEIMFGKEVMKARMSEIIEKLTPDQCEHFAYALEQVASCYLSSSSHGALLIAAAIKKLHLVGLLKVSKSKKPSTTKFHSTWFKARFAETCKFTARNQVRKSHEVLRQTEFETPFPGQWCRLQSGAQSKKPRMVRGLRLPQGLLSRFEVFVLAGQKGFKLSIKPIPQLPSTDLGCYTNMLQ